MDDNEQTSWRWSLSSLLVLVCFCTKNTSQLAQKLLGRGQIWQYFTKLANLEINSFLGMRSYLPRLTHPGVIIIWHQPKQCTIIFGKCPNVIIHLHCLNPPNMGNSMTPGPLHPNLLLEECCMAPLCLLGKPWLKHWCTNVVYFGIWNNKALINRAGQTVKHAASRIKHWKWCSFQVGQLKIETPCLRKFLWLPFLHYPLVN